MPYRSAFIGTGHRAQEHARVYPSLRGLSLDAAADLDAARLDAFAQKHGIPHVFGDYRRMLAQRKPEIVHLVTNPTLRVEPVRACADAGVKAVIVEKPMGLSLADADAIEKIARDSGLKVVVNTQRRYFPTVLELCDLVRSGRAGRVHFIRAHSLSAVFCTGSHTLDMIEAILGDTDPVTVWSAAYGAEEYHSTHPGSANFLASITYPDRTQVLFEASREGAGIHGCDSFFMATRFDVLTDRGAIWWTEVNGWGYQLAGMSEPRTFPTNFMEDDKQGQAAFTQAVVDWLDDPGKPHGNRLETALRVFRIIAAMVQSATQNRRVEFEPAKLVDTAGELRKRLEAAEGVHPEKQGWSWVRPRV